MLPSTEHGHLRGVFPYVRVGDGPRTLVVVPGIGDAMADGEYGPLVARGLARYLRRFLEEYTVYLVSRPRRLAADATIEEMAAGYGRVLETELGSASVLGLSMGGLIGQALAYRRPDLVERLVVAVSGCRLAPGSEPILREIRQLAVDHEWTEIRTRLLETMYVGRRRTLYPALARVLGRVRPPRPAAPRDVVVSAEAVLEFDWTDRLGGIEPPTLVVGADEDPFFPESILRETADGLPESRLAVFRGERHGVFQERKRTFEEIVRRFLAGRPVEAVATG